MSGDAMSCGDVGTGVMGIDVPVAAVGDEARMDWLECEDWVRMLDGKGDTSSSFEF